MNQITFKQYRSIDVAIFTVLTAVFEYIVALATKNWFNLQAMSISVSLMLICITMMRWNAFSVLPALVGAFSYCYALGANSSQYLIYCGGSLFSLLSLIIIKRMGKERIRASYFRIFFFATSTYLFMAIGKWLISIILFGFDINVIIRFISTDILSLLFACIVLSIVKRTDGLIEDQKAYLFRLERERQEEQESSEDNF